MSSDWLTTKIKKAWSSCFRIDFVERKKIFSLYFFSNKNVGVGSRFQNIISVKIEDSVEERFFRTDIETSIKLLSNLTAALNLLSMKYKSLLLCKTISKKIQDKVKKRLEWRSHSAATFVMKLSVWGLNWGPILRKNMTSKSKVMRLPRQADWLPCPFLSYFFVGLACH